MTTRSVVDRAIGGGALALAALAPLIFSDYWLGALLTQTLFLGIVASSLIFLSAYGGMVSLAQVALYGIAGFVLGNVVTNGNTKGLNLGWNPWLAVVLAIAITVLVAVLFGLLASRSVGIYFLMITLTFGVIANLFFGQVTTFSGFGGISGIPAPHPIGPVDEHPNRLYYVALVVSVLVYALLRYVPHAVRARLRVSVTTRADGVSSATTSCSTGRSRSRSRASSPRSQACCSSGGTRSTRRRST